MTSKKNRDIHSDTINFIDSINGGEFAINHFRAIHPKTSDVKSFSGYIEEIHPHLKLLNESGYGIFMTINITDGQGLKNQNVVGLTAFFMDFDDPQRDNLTDIESLPIEPSFIIETSPNKYHVYYILNDTPPVNCFTAIQGQLASRYNTDSCVKDPARVMRVPGFNHTKGAPFLTKIIADTGEYHEFEDIKKKFKLSEIQHSPIPVINNNIAQRLKPSELQLECIEKLLNNIPPDIEYHEWRNVIAGVVEKLGQFDSVINLLDNWSQKGNKYKGRNEITKIVNSFPPQESGGITYATFCSIAQKYGANLTKTVPKIETETSAVEFPHVIETRQGKKAVNTSGNLKALANHFGLEFRFNLMTFEPEVCELGKQERLSNSYDSIRSKIISLANLTGLAKSAFDDHFSALSEENKQHPIKNWLDSSCWDGKKRVNEIIDCLNAKDKEMARNVMTKWLIGCVASLYVHKFKSKLVPILQGDQSFMKTAFIERISDVCPYAFLEGAELNPDNKDSILKCIKSWIIELGELERTSRNSQGSLKAFITQSIDTVRPPYARTDIHKPRQSHYIASVNGSDFLKDDTGNTRFVVMEMTAPANMDKVNQILGWEYNGTGSIKKTEPELLKQFWLEVKDKYNKGEGWMLSKSEVEKLSSINDSYTDKGTVYQYIKEKYVGNHSCFFNNWFTSGQMVDKDVKLTVNLTSQIGKALKRLANEGLIETKKGRSNKTMYLIPSNKVFAPVPSIIID